MKKRLLAAVLCLVMLISCVPSFAFQAQASQLPVITCNGSAQSAVSFPRNERITLTAEGGAWYQWQIKVNDSLWVNISGETGATLDVSYAMIANLCQGDTAYLRVVADGERKSDPVAVTATEAVIKEAAAPAAASYVLKAAPRVVVSDPSTDSSTGSSAADSANTEAVDQAQAALTAAEAAANEAAKTAAAAKENAAAKEAAYYEAQNKADAAKEAMEASAVTTEIPAETSADLDENGNPMVVKSAETVVNYNSELQTAYAAAQAEAEAAWQVYSEAAITLADAEANLETARAAVETAAAELKAAQNQTTGENPGSSNYNLTREATTPSTYNVVINYVFENNEIVSDPYTATLAAGSPFSATVTFPTVQGYLPYLGEVQQNSLELNYTAIDKDYTYNVVYKPTNVNYTVIHYQQNLGDDYYVEAERETKQGPTKSTVGDVAKTYEGFYALLYEKPAIAADGSTVVEVYYDRYYYLMNFDLGGGYGVEPIYARYGAPVSVGTPTKAGYSFAGWNPLVPDTVPVDGGTYAAVWTPDDTAKVTIAFWGENADDEEYSYLDYSAVVYMKPGKEFTYSPGNTIICDLEPHTHSIDDCYEFTCTKEPHTHSEACYTCGQGSHTHDTSCYAGVGSASSAGTGAPSNPSNGYVAREAWSWGGKVIYINGTWYKYTGSTDTGKIAPTICNKTEGTHTHTDACLGCNQTEHIHSVENGCYELTCPKKEHSHTSDCYMNGAGLDSDKWKFERSDTVTVAADGSTVVNVYYKRVVYKVQFFRTDKNGGAEYTDLVITAKWNASIYDKWPTYNGSSSWYVNKNGSGAWQVGIQVMPVGGAKFYGPKTGSTSITAYYYVEVLPGETGESHNGVTYKLHHTDTSSSSGNVSSEDKYPIQGFTYKEGTSDGQSYNGAKFYYTRNAYDIKFFNPTDLIKTEEEVPYEMPLGRYDFVPGDEWIPKQYEPGSMKFDGWYLNPECTGEQYVLSKHTMPLGPENHEAALSLYAKWVPVTHTVEFYLDKGAMEAGTKMTETHPDLTVPHGSKVKNVPATPSNGNYKFVGWFYMDGNTEKAFDFANMPVTKNMKVYGKWSSDTLMQYFVYYKIKNTDTEIADPTTGSALAGSTKTFDAKGGTDLYADYQEGYFPTTQSHSMIIDIDDASKNSFTFEYVQAEAVPYTVHYVTDNPRDDWDTTLGTIDIGGKTYYKVAATVSVEDNHKAVVTETFKPVTSYMPDAYQKRLVVSVKEDGTPDTDKNVIVFYYTQDNTHAYYKITHYTENLAKDSQGNTTWTEYASSQAVGDIDSPYEGEPMTIPGFTYSTEVTGDQYKGILTANGLELKLYYTRNSYPYQVRYLEQGTGKQLADRKDGTGKYGQVISEGAIAIDNYTAVDPTSQTLNIRIEEGNEAVLNIIYFYYTENEATINYQVVGPTTDCGTVSLPSETLKVLTGKVQGSTATASSNTFRFVGWYADAECNTPVNASWVDANNKLTPVKDKDAAWQNKTYYAKFEYNLTTLTITKFNALNDNDGFIFDVTGNGESYTVSVKGNGSVTIAGVTVGATYTITERSDWAWRYKVPEAQQITLVANGAENIVEVRNSGGKQYLLDGSAYAHNIDETKPAGDK